MISVGSEVRVLPGPYLWGFSSAGRAPALQAGGHRFDPDNLQGSCWWALLSREDGTSGPRASRFARPGAKGVPQRFRPMCSFSLGGERGGLLRAPAAPALCSCESGSGASLDAQDTSVASWSGAIALGLEVIGEVRCGSVASGLAERLGSFPWWGWDRCSTAGLRQRSEALKLDVPERVRPCVLRLRRSCRGIGVVHAGVSGVDGSCAWRVRLAVQR